MKGKLIKEYARSANHENVLQFTLKILGIDGGPGSGNFGHKGRPGMVGGSGKGGGLQYRGGRSDIGYFGSRQDWLNGLSGEKQHEAVKHIARIKEEMNHRQKAKERIEKRFNQGLITENEKNEKLKAAGLENFNKQDSPEVFLLKCGKTEEKRELLDRIREARSWDKTKNRLMNENLSDEERKVYDYIHDHFLDIENISRKERMDTLHNLEAKAMGIDVPVDISDDMLIAAGVKEPPKPKGPDYDWWKPSGERYGYYSSSMEQNMCSMMGERAYYGQRYTKEEFADINQRFVDFMQYAAMKEMKPTDLRYYGMRAVRGLRENVMKDGDSYQDRINKLSDDEKARLLEIANQFKKKYNAPFESIDNMSSYDFENIERVMWATTPRSNKDKQMYRDYILLNEKMFAGAEPSTKEEYEEAQKRKEEERKRKEEEARKERERQEEEARKRQEEAERRRQELERKQKEAMKNAREARAKGEKVRDPNGRYAQSVGASDYEEICGKIDDCGDFDVQVAWDAYTPDIPLYHVTSPTRCCWMPGLGRIEMNVSYYKTGDSIHAPFESIYHEVGHGIDCLAAERFGYKSSPFSAYPHFSSLWKNGEFYKTIEAEGNAFVEQIGNEAKKEFDEIEEWTDTLYAKYYGGSGDLWKYKAGIKKPEWTDELRDKMVGKWLERQDRIAIANVCDAIQGVTRNRIKVVAGHSSTYYTGHDRYENMATEMFAEMYAGTIANQKCMDVYKKYFPKTYACFQQMLKEVAGG